MTEDIGIGQGDASKVYGEPPGMTASKVSH
jgi:hypothetical protein